MSKPNINEVYFERVFNLGNYETFRIGLRATVSPKDILSDVIQQLDDKTVEIRSKTGRK